MRKRILSLLMAVAMVVSMLPTMAVTAGAATACNHTGWGEYNADNVNDFYKAMTDSGEQYLKLVNVTSNEFTYGASTYQDDRNPVITGDIHLCLNGFRLLGSDPTMGTGTMTIDGGSLTVCSPSVVSGGAQFLRGCTIEIVNGGTLTLQGNMEWTCPIYVKEGTLNILSDAYPCDSFSPYIYINEKGCTLNYFYGTEYAGDLLQVYDFYSDSEEADWANTVLEFKYYNDSEYSEISAEIKGPETSSKLGKYSDTVEIHLNNYNAEVYTASDFGEVHFGNAGGKIYSQYIYNSTNYTMNTVYPYSIYNHGTNAIEVGSYIKYTVDQEEDYKVSYYYDAFTKDGVAYPVLKGTFNQNTWKDDFIALKVYDANGSSDGVVLTRNSDGTIISAHRCKAGNWTYDESSGQHKNYCVVESCGAEMSSAACSNFVWKNASGSTTTVVETCYDCGHQTSNTATVTPAGGKDAIIYDGSAVTPAEIASVTGFVGTPTYTWNYNGKNQGSTAPTEVTSGTLYITDSGRSFASGSSLSVTFTMQQAAQGTVSSTAPSITAPTDGQDMTYGETYSLAGTDGVGDVTWSVKESADAALVEIDNDADTVRIKGYDANNTQVTLVATWAGDTNYSAMFREVTVDLLPRPITVTAENKTMTFGGDVPEYTAAVTEGSVVNGDALDYDFSTNYTGQGTGSYTITVADGTAANAANSKYDITYVTGTLTVTDAELSVTIKQNKDLYYNGQEQTPVSD